MKTVIVFGVDIIEYDICKLTTIQNLIQLKWELLLYKKAKH